MEQEPANITYIRKEFERVSTWDEWYEFADKYFDWERTPSRTLEQMDEDMQREPVRSANRVWEPIAANYDIDPEFEFLFDDLSNRIFAKLEPAAHKHNKEHPELFGWKCITCRVFTRVKTAKCSFCGKQLLPLPLNE